MHRHHVPEPEPDLRLGPREVRWLCASESLYELHARELAQSASTPSTNDGSVLSRVVTAIVAMIVWFVHHT